MEGEGGGVERLAFSGGSVGFPSYMKVSIYLMQGTYYFFEPKLVEVC